MFSSFLLYLGKSTNFFPKFKSSLFHLFCFTYVILQEYYVKTMDFPLLKDAQTSAKGWLLRTPFLPRGKKQQSGYKDDTVQPVHSVGQKLGTVLIQYTHF